MVSTLTKVSQFLLAPTLATAVATTLNPSLVGAEGVKPLSPSNSTKNSITVDDTGKSSKAVPPSSVLTTSPTNPTPKTFDLAAVSRPVIDLTNPLAASKVKPNDIQPSSTKNSNPVKDVNNRAPTVLVTQNPRAAAPELPSGYGEAGAAVIVGLQNQINKNNQIIKQDDQNLVNQAQQNSDKFQQFLNNRQKKVN
jgi:hypothetical protein